MVKVTGLNGKRALISKANSNMVIMTSVAAFVVVFCLVTSKTLLSQMNYQNRVIGEKHKALHQLQSDVKAASDLTTSYNAFNNTAQNAIGGNPSGTGAHDGNNTKIVLDALPNTYDFPALVTSIEKLVNVNGATVGAISGTDDEVAQSANLISGSPQPVAIPFSITVSGNYQAVQDVESQFERSIRPMQVQTMSLSGNQDNMTMTLTVQTFYQPGKQLNIGSKVVK